MARSRSSIYAVEVDEVDDDCSCGALTLGKDNARCEMLPLRCKMPLCHTNTQRRNAFDSYSCCGNK
eukprot:scaffold1726_cov103-Skeletonema_dohrnii-CCMP3373.AAC.2